MAEDVVDDHVEILDRPIFPRTRLDMDHNIAQVLQLSAVKSEQSDDSPPLGFHPAGGLDDVRRVTAR